MNLSGSLIAAGLFGSLAFSVLPVGIAKSQDTGKKVIQPMANAPIEDQTRRTLDNLKAVLEAAGLSMDHIVSTTVFLKDISEFGKMNEVYATYFSDAPPARATVEVARLPRDLKVEISAIAVRP